MADLGRLGEMKTVISSFVATAIGFSAFLGSLIGYQLRTLGRMADIMSTIFWVGIFALIAWATAVVPVMLTYGSRKIFSDFRVSWLGWGVLGMLCYVVLTAPMTLTGGFVILLGIWVPALIGCIAGLVFGLLSRERRTTSAQPGTSGQRP